MRCVFFVFSVVFVYRRLNVLLVIDCVMLYGLFFLLRRCACVFSSNVLVRCVSFCGMV